MVTNSTAVFRAVADPIRREILGRLRGKAIETGKLALGFPVSRPAVSKHLRILAEAGLVRRRRLGRRCLYSLNAAPLKGLEDWLSLYREFWEKNLGSLKSFVEDEGEKGVSWPTSKSTKERSSRRSGSKRRRKRSSGRSRSRNTS